MGILEGKRRELDKILMALPSAIVAYSGGADSAFLAEVANQRLDRESLAVTADSPSLPRRELSAAIDLALARGWNHLVIPTSELEDESYASNPSNRCYFCKSSLFDAIDRISGKNNVPVMLGTNTDDLSDYRPGHMAADERGVRHPLVEVGLSKADIRELSRRAGLPTWDKPAAACLASRFAYGVRVTTLGLARIEASEDALIQCGYRVVRVRDLGANRARVEVGVDELERIASEMRLVMGTLEALGWNDVIIDERGYRRGAMNEGVVPVSIGERPSS